MTWLEALFLGVLQGVTEFLPISSSGHLVLGEHYLGLEVQELLSFDVIVHLGSLLAILIYFWKDIWMMIKSLGKFFSACCGSKAALKDDSVKMIGWILIGSVPAVVAGFTLKDWITESFRSVESVGIAMLILAGVFVGGELIYKKKKDGDSGKMNWKKAVLIGFAQAMALIPGISRSGSTIVTGMFQGISREAAARFSFLLGVPVIAGAGLLTSLDMMSENAATSSAAIGGLELFAGFTASFLAGLVSVAFLMKFLKKNSLLVFAVYLAVVGLAAILLG